MSQVRFFPTFPAVGALLLMVMLAMSCGDKDVFSPSDGIAPSTPGTPTATAVSHTQINLTWSASTDNGNITNGGVQGYRVFRNGSYLRFVKTASMSDEGLAASTLYKYRVQAQDGSGQLSALTAETDQAAATTQATPALAPDVTVPAKATAVVALETASMP